MTLICYISSYLMIRCILLLLHCIVLYANTGSVKLPGMRGEVALTIGAILCRVARVIEHTILPSAFCRSQCWQYMCHLWEKQGGSKSQEMYSLLFVSSLLREQVFYCIWQQTISCCPCSIHHSSAWRTSHIEHDLKGKKWAEKTEGKGH